VENIGVFNSAQNSEASGLRNLKRVYWNLEAPALYEQSLTRGETKLVQGGALLAETGVHTGRSPKDKFVVRDATTENEIWWENNGAITPDQFDTLLSDFLAHAEGKELFAQDLYGGADPAYRVKARVFTEFAWHSLFIRNLLIRPDRSEIAVARSWSEAPRRKDHCSRKCCGTTFPTSTRAPRFSGRRSPGCRYASAPSASRCPAAAR